MSSREESFKVLQEFYKRQGFLPRINSEKNLYDFMVHSVEGNDCLSVIIYNFLRFVSDDPVHKRLPAPLESNPLKRKRPDLKGKERKDNILDHFDDFCAFYKKNNRFPMQSIPKEKNIYKFLVICNKKLREGNLPKKILDYLNEIGWFVNGKTNSRKGIHFKNTIDLRAPQEDLSSLEDLYSKDDVDSVGEFTLISQA